MDFQKCNEPTSPDNYVAIAAHFNSREDTLTHAAIVIRYKGKYHLHHFPGQEKPTVECDSPMNGWGVYKIVDILSQSETVVGSVLAQCRSICANSKVIYSYIGVSGKHDNDGRYVTKSGLPEIATCVGFCVNTLNTVLMDAETDYFEFSEWPHYPGNIELSTVGEAALRKNYPDLDWALVEKYRKRITVPQYFASSFIDQYPIRKERVDYLVEDLLDKVRVMYPKVVQGVLFPVDAVQHRTGTRIEATSSTPFTLGSKSI